jgi:glycosyltransferase involved in cell wall biosynthesis
LAPETSAAATIGGVTASGRDPSLLTVLLPCRNGEAVLGQQLKSLARQTYPGPLEVIVVENGSDDNSRAVAESFLGRIRGLRVIEVDGSGGKPGAVNAALTDVHGEKLVMIDADDTLDEQFLAAMSAALDEHTFVGGRLDSDELNDEDIRRWRGKIHDDELTVMLKHLPVVGGGAIGVRTSAFEQVGGYDTRFISNQDVDLSWRLQYAGHQPRFVPDAVVHYRFRSSPGAIFQQERAYGRYSALLYREHRPHGLPRRRLVSVLRAWAELVVALLGLGTKAGRARLATRAGAVLGRLEGSVRYRVLYL